MVNLKTLVCNFHCPRLPKARIIAKFNVIIF
jgi:hypothetical protein